MKRLQVDFTHLDARVEDSKTVLIWPDQIPQRDFLHLLEKLDQEGLTILHAGRREATLEEVFVLLTSKNGSDK